MRRYPRVACRGQEIPPGQCLLGVHPWDRLIHAIRGRAAAGDDIDTLCSDYPYLPRQAIVEIVWGNRRELELGIGW